MSICGIIGSERHKELVLFGDLSCSYMDGTYPVSGDDKVFSCTSRMLRLYDQRKVALMFGVVGSTGISGLIKHWVNRATDVGHPFMDIYTIVLDLKNFLKDEGIMNRSGALSVLCLVEGKSGGFEEVKSFNIPLGDDSNVIDMVDDMCMEGYYASVNGYQSETAFNLWMHCIQRENIPMKTRVRIFLDCLGRVAQYSNCLEPAFRLYRVFCGSDGFYHVESDYFIKER